MTDLDPDTFDIDAWIDGASRPETVVELHREGHLHARLAELEHKIRVAQAVPDGERSITDESPQSLQDEWAEVAKQWSDSALKVRVKALTTPEMKQARKAAEKAKAPEDDVVMWIIAEGIIEPKMSPQQLVKLRERIGEAEIALLNAAILRLSQDAPRPTAPFSQGRSRGTRA